MLNYFICALFHRKHWTALPQGEDDKANAKCAKCKTYHF